MSSYDEEYSLERTVNKFEEKIGVMLKTIGSFLKKELGNKFSDDLEMSADCYIENVEAFRDSARKTIFSKNFGNEYGYKMPEFKSGTEGAEKENKQAVKDIIQWMKENDVLEEYLENVRKNCDYSIYIKFLEFAKSKKFNKMILNDYGINLKETKNFFGYVRMNIRNKEAHNTDATLKHHKNGKMMQKDADYLLKLANMFFNLEDNKAVKTRVQKDYEAAIEVANSCPIALSDILNTFPVFESENDVINAFDIDYDATNHYLYANSLKMVEAVANTISPSSKNIREEMKEKAKVTSVIKEEVLKDASRKINTEEISSLLVYKNQITAKQIAELGEKTSILIDGEVFEGNKLFEDDDLNNRSFVLNNVLKPLEKIKKFAIINYSSRIALNRKYYEATNDGEKDRAKKARDQIHYFVERAGLRYSQTTGIVYKSGIYETIKTIEANPKARFFVIVNNAKDANLIEENGFDNVLIARVIGFGNDKELRLTNNSLSQIEPFAKYEFSELDEEVVEAPSVEEVQNEVTSTNETSESPVQQEPIPVAEQPVAPVEVATCIPDEICTEIVNPDETSEKEAETHTEEADLENSRITKNTENDFSGNNSVQSSDKDGDGGKEEVSSPSEKQIIKLPVIASVDCIPDENEMLAMTIIPSEGDTLTTSANEQVILHKKIGEGGEGSIYELSESLVAKVYHKNRLTKSRFDKLNLMIKCGFESERVCFPLDLLFNANNEFVGYTMKKAPSNYMNIGESILQLNNKSALKKYPDLQKWDRYSLTSFCANLADIFVNLHDSNILMGDINAGNILVDIKDTSGESILVVDTDSFQIGPYPCPVGTPVFTSPEIYKRTNEQYPRYGNFLRTLGDEQYALASLFFQILLLGQTPFAGKGVVGEGIEALKSYNFDYRGENSTGADVPDGPFRMIWQNIGLTVKKMFEETFTGKKTYSAKQWRNALKVYAKNIKDGKADNNLKPYRYPKASFMKEFVCDRCHRPANLPENQYDRKIKYKDLLLCKECDQEWLATVRETMVTASCSICGKQFEASAYDVLRQQMKNYSLKCDNCDGYVDTKCYLCQTPIKVPRYKYNDSKYHGRFRCDACMQKLNEQRELEEKLRRYELGDYDDFDNDSDDDWDNDEDLWKDDDLFEADEDLENDEIEDEGNEDSE